MKHAKNLFQTLSRMVVLEEMRIYGNMSLDNVLDVQVIANAIANHPRLRIVEFRDFVVYANDHKGSKPLLEPLINAVATLKHLESLQLKCFACYKSWRRAFCSSQALKPLCRTHGVVRLDLCGIGLRDEHFRTLTEEIGSNDTTRISELLLNGNENTDVGLCDIAGLLQRNGTIERLEAHSMRRPNESTCAKILQALEKNYVLRHFLINIPHNFRSEIDFYLLLNRAGRKSMLDPKVGPAQIVNVLEAANDNVGVMMFLLRENPSLCQIQSKNVPLEEISESFINDDPPHAEETTETSTCEESEEEGKHISVPEPIRSIISVRLIQRAKPMRSYPYGDGSSGSPTTTGTYPCLERILVRGGCFCGRCQRCSIDMVHS